MFEQNIAIKDLTKQDLIIKNKANKKKSIDNLRPIGLLNTIRKIFSAILLKRLQQKTQSYIAEYQYGFVPKKSRQHIIWTYKWLLAANKKMNQIQQVLRINISKAFDSLPRSKRLNVLHQICDNDDDVIRMCHIILAASELQIKYHNERSQSFTSNVGVPEGDLISPLLFIIYLEAIIYELLSENDHLKLLIFIYADDVDFIHQLLNHELDDFLALLTFKFAEWGLSLNPQKTEDWALDINPTHHQNIKKLGSMINPKDQINKCLSKVKLAFNIT